MAHVADIGTQSDNHQHMTLAKEVYVFNLHKIPQTCIQMYILR